MWLLANTTGAAALQPQQIAIIVNTNSEDSKTIAQYYCFKRGVPQGNIISVPMDQTEIIDRNTYQQDLAPQIRARLNQQDLKDKIQCLLTVRGVPLRIDSVRLNPTQRKRRDLIIKLLNQNFGELGQLTEQFELLAKSDASISSPTSDKNEKFRFSGIRSVRDHLAVKMLIKANQAINQAQQSLRDAATRGLAHQDQLQRFMELAGNWGGLRGKIQNFSAQLNASADENHKKLLQQQLNQSQARLEELTEIIKQGPQQRDDISFQEKYYEAVLEMAGLQGLCNTLILDRHNLGDEESHSSFDSELSLVLWKPYRLAQWQFNQLRVYEHEMLKDRSIEPFLSLWLGENAPDGPGYMGIGQPEYPALMVARLDGPSLEIALGLVDKALEAEKQPLGGTAYFDARGIHKDQQITGSPGFYDQSLRDAAHLVEQETGLTVKLDDQEELFPPGACPDASLYCGWYKLRNYVDSFQFNVGAVGYHIASYEAETLGAADPNSNVWCKRMLENGITATLGAVAEPYLYAFVRPDQLFKELLSEKYCLVECFYRTNPFNSWMLTLIGDPLYQPKFTRRQHGFIPRS